VLAHTLDLVDQLERALWRHVPKTVSSQQLNGREKPENLPGITVATIQSAINYVRKGFRPDFIFVDEAHHTGEASQLAEALQTCHNAVRLGATATPWRGDEFDVAEFFGQPSFKLGIEEGMRLGFLADVDYRLFVDNINWDYVHEQSEKNLTIKDLNRRLFLPQRDESIRDELYNVWMRTAAPRGIVFCQTIEHCERLAGVLRQIPAWGLTSTLHNDVPKSEQKARLAQFRLGDIPLLVAVDILNEGVDVPDVNVVCFARVTHSRRIFIQQLGRGLRLSPGKTHVSVLDFVSDLKRVAAAMQLRAEVVDEPEVLYLPSSHSITFNNAEAESLLAEWIYDAADLETTADEVKLNFPPFSGHRR
jgi:superfamily II DNA or RNA helicase